jgi:hypothetical protein
MKFFTLVLCKPNLVLLYTLHQYLPSLLGGELGITPTCSLGCLSRVKKSEPSADQKIGWMGSWILTGALTRGTYSLKPQSYLSGMLSYLLHNPSQFILISPT